MELDFDTALQTLLNDAAADQLDVTRREMIRRRAQELLHRIDALPRPATPNAQDQLKQARGQLESVMQRNEEKAAPATHEEAVAQVVFQTAQAVGVVGEAVGNMAEQQHASNRSISELARRLGLVADQMGHSAVDSEATRHELADLRMAVIDLASQNLTETERTRLNSIAQLREDVDAIAHRLREAAEMHEHLHALTTRLDEAEQAAGGFSVALQTVHAVAASMENVSHDFVVSAAQADEKLQAAELVQREAGVSAAAMHRVLEDVKDLIRTSAGQVATVTEISEGIATQAGVATAAADQSAAALRQVTAHVQHTDLLHAELIGLAEQANDELRETRTHVADLTQQAHDNLHAIAQQTQQTLTQTSEQGCLSIDAAAHQAREEFITTTQHAHETLLSSAQQATASFTAASEHVQAAAARAQEQAADAAQSRDEAAAAAQAITDEATQWFEASQQQASAMQVAAQGIDEATHAAREISLHITEEQQLLEASAQARATQLELLAQQELRVSDHAGAAAAAEAAAQKMVSDLDDRTKGSEGRIRLMRDEILQLQQGFIGQLEQHLHGMSQMVSEVGASAIQVKRDREDTADQRQRAEAAATAAEASHTRAHEMLQTAAEQVGELREARRVLEDLHAATRSDMHRAAGQLASAQEIAVAASASAAQAQDAVDTAREQKHATASHERGAAAAAESAAVSMRQAADTAENALLAAQQAATHAGESSGQARIVERLHAETRLALTRAQRISEETTDHAQNAEQARGRAAAAAGAAHADARAAESLQLQASSAARSVAQTYEVFVEEAARVQALLVESNGIAEQVAHTQRSLQVSVAALRDQAGVTLNDVVRLAAASKTDVAAVRSIAETARRYFQRLEINLPELDALAQRSHAASESAGKAQAAAEDAATCASQHARNGAEQARATHEQLAQAQSLVDHITHHIEPRIVEHEQDAHAAAVRAHSAAAAAKDDREQTSELLKHADATTVLIDRQLNDSRAHKADLEALTTDLQAQLVDVVAHGQRTAESLREAQAQAASLGRHGDELQATQNDLLLRGQGLARSSEELQEVSERISDVLAQTQLVAAATATEAAAVSRAADQVSADRAVLEAMAAAMRRDADAAEQSRAAAHDAQAAAQQASASAQLQHDLVNQSIEAAAQHHRGLRRMFKRQRKASEAR